MKSWLRVSLFVVLGLVVLLAAAVGAGLALEGRRINRQIEVAVQPVAIPADAQSLERGRYLFASRGCAECHGADGAGRRFVEESGLTLAGANITRGSGGVVDRYQVADWVRTLRHGVKPDGRAIRVMPSEDYNRLSAADLGAVIAYAQALPSASGGPAVLRLPLPARVLYGFGQIPDAADKIDHRLPPPAAAAEGITVGYGQYVTSACIGCHGSGLEGGKIAGGPPDWPAAARLVPGEGNVMATRYADADAFVKMLQSGQRPDGSAVAVMPFETLSKMSETEMRALHLYLRGLAPPR